MAPSPRRPRSPARRSTRTPRAPTLRTCRSPTCPPGSTRSPRASADDEVASRTLLVGPIAKPAWKLALEVPKRAVLTGSGVTVNAEAAFFEGTPVAGSDLRFSADNEDDGEGNAGTPDQVDHRRRGPCHRQCARPPWRRRLRRETSGPSSPSMSGRTIPRRATSTRTRRSSSSAPRPCSTSSPSSRARRSRSRAPCTRWSSTATTRIRRPTCTRSIPRGAPLAGRRVEIRISEQTQVTRQTGTRYDFIAKRTVPVYESSTRTKVLPAQVATTGLDGTLPAGRHRQGRRSLLRGAGHARGPRGPDGQGAGIGLGPGDARDDEHASLVRAGSDEGVGHLRRRRHREGPVRPRDHEPPGLALPVHRPGPRTALRRGPGLAVVLDPLHVRPRPQRPDHGRPVHGHRLRGERRVRRRPPGRGPRTGRHVDRGPGSLPAGRAGDGHRQHAHRDRTADIGVRLRARRGREAVRHGRRQHGRPARRAVRIDRQRAGGDGLVPREPARGRWRRQGRHHGRRAASARTSATGWWPGSSPPARTAGPRSRSTSPTTSPRGGSSARRSPPASRQASAMCMSRWGCRSSPRSSWRRSTWPSTGPPSGSGPTGQRCAPGTRSGSRLRRAPCRSLR